MLLVPVRDWMQFIGATDEATMLCIGRLYGPLIVQVLAKSLSSTVHSDNIDLSVHATYHDLVLAPFYVVDESITE